MKEYLEAGEFVTTHGVMGELKLYPWCDDADFITQLPRLFLGRNGKKEQKVLSARVHKGMCLVKLEGVDSMDAARALVRKIAYFSRADVQLPEGRFFVQDIIGCKVLDADTKQEYGTLTDVTHPAASDVYEVRNEQGEIFLFPAVKEFLGELKPEEGFITVRPIAGMFTSGGGNDDED